MSYNLFLDDFRNPADCVTYMHTRIGTRNPVYVNEHWIVVKSYDAFVEIIHRNGNPRIISFDHDLAAEHYIDLVEGGMSKRKARQLKKFEKTGYEAAKWYLGYLKETKQDCAEIFIHSMNPVGTENIKSLFK